MTKWKNVYLGLGSNLSNPKLQLKQAIQLLNQCKEINTLQQAPLYQTPAWGVTDQPDFINSALHIKTTLSPLQLLSQIKDIEYRQMGRQLNARWHERVIDIDILLFEEQFIYTEELTIPHPLIAERWFVILPLMTLKPKLPQELDSTIQNKLLTDKPPEEICIIN